ncbi:MAG: MFS transporter [Actinomycetaceae bacterium]|nr:MFS transporter [Actinomycetaceae bacterium]
MRTAEKTKFTPVEHLLLLGSLVLILSLAFEGTATTNAMPTIITELGGDQWYSLAAGMKMAGQIISIVIAGWWADRYGAGRPLVVGMIAFAAGALLAGMAPALWMFVAGRAIAGLGSGLIMVPLYVMVGGIASPGKRPTFFAVFSFGWALPAIVGPSIAGFIVELWGWRPVFWLVAVVALLALAPLAPLFKRLPEHREVNTPAPPVLVGAVLTSIGIMALQVSGGLSGASALIAIAVGVVLIAVSMPGLLPKGTFRAKEGVAAVVGMRVALMGSITGVQFFLPLVLSRVHGWTPTQTGWAIAIGTTAWAIGAWAQTQVRPWDKRTRIPVVAAGLLIAGAVLALTMPLVSVPPYVSVIGISLMGLGQGFAHATSSDLALGVTAQSKHGEISASVQLADSIGPALTMGFISIAFSAWERLTESTPYIAAPGVSLILAVLMLFAALRIIGLQRRQD